MQEFKKEERGLIMDTKFTVDDVPNISFSGDISVQELSVKELIALVCTSVFVVADSVGEEDEARKEFVLTVSDTLKDMVDLVVKEDDENEE